MLIQGWFFLFEYSPCCIESPFWFFLESLLTLGFSLICSSVLQLWNHVFGCFLLFFINVPVGVTISIPWKQVLSDEESGKEFILCEYNRDADSYRWKVHLHAISWIFDVILFLSFVIFLCLHAYILLSEASTDCWAFKQWVNRFQLLNAHPKKFSLSILSYIIV